MTWERRYDVVKTEGFANATGTAYSAEVAVVDNCNCGRIVALFTVWGVSPKAPTFIRKLVDAEEKAERHCAERNEREEAWLEATA